MTAGSNWTGSPWPPKMNVWARAGAATPSSRTAATTATARVKRIGVSPSWMVGVTRKGAKTIALRRPASNWLPAPEAPRMPDRAPRATPERTTPSPSGGPRQGARQQPRGSVGPEPRVERVAQAVAHEIEPQDRQHDGGAGEEEHPPGAAGEVLVRVRQHGPPLGRRRLGSQPQEPQGRRFQDGERDGE